MFFFVRPAIHRIGPDQGVAIFIVNVLKCRFFRARSHAVDLFLHRQIKVRTVEGVRSFFPSSSEGIVHTHTHTPAYFDTHILEQCNQFLLPLCVCNPKAMSWQRGAWKGGNWQHDWQQGAWKGGHWQHWQHDWQQGASKGGNRQHDWQHDWQRFCSHGHGWSLDTEEADGWSRDIADLGVCAAFCANRLPLEKACRYPHDTGGWLHAFTLAGSGTSQPDMRKIRALRTLIWAQTRQVCRGESCVLFESMGDLELEDPPSYTYRVYASPFAAPDCLQQFPLCNPLCNMAECDMLDYAEDLVHQGFSVAILNMAAATKPGGGVHWGAGAQEENLHRRSDAMRFTMDQQKYNYPLEGSMCLLSHGVTIFRGNEHNGYPFLRKPFKVTMISCAAPPRPQLVWDSSEQCQYWCVKEHTKMDGKVAAIVQAVVESGCDAAVLSAFGCGAFGHPPELVAKMFHKHLAHLSPHSGLKQVTFCIVNDHNSFRPHNPGGNVTAFSNLFSKTGPGAMPTLQAGRHSSTALRGRVRLGMCFPYAAAHQWSPQCKGR